MHIRLLEVYLIIVPFRGILCDFMYAPECIVTSLVVRFSRVEYDEPCIVYHENTQLVS